MSDIPVRHEDGHPHDSHGWVRDEDPDNEAWPWVCGGCGVNIEDDEAVDPCTAVAWHGHEPSPATRNPHPHFDVYCRDHDVRIGGCRCPSEDKVKQYADCPGEICPRLSRNAVEGWLATTIHEELYGESPDDDGPTTMAWRVAAAVADVFDAIRNELEE